MQSFAVGAPFKKRHGQTVSALISRGTLFLLFSQFLPKRMSLSFCDSRMARAGRERNLSIKVLEGGTLRMLFFCLSCFFFVAAVAHAAGQGDSDRNLEKRRAELK